MMTSYQTAHARVWRNRGRARDHVCVCGKPAAHWAYDHLDPDELVDSAGQIFSGDPAHYTPLCRSCHANLDNRHPRCGRAEPVGWFTVGVRSFPVRTPAQFAAFARGPRGPGHGRDHLRRRAA
jgi:hypothetical protein